MAFNKNNKKLVTTALTAAMVASAVAPVAAAKLTPAQAATNAVKAYTNFKVTTVSEASKSVASKNAALAAVKKLGSKDAKLKASLTASINKKDAAVKLVVANIQKADAAVKAYEATKVTSVSGYKATGPVKYAAQKAVAALVSPGLKASYTAKIDAQFASLTDAYNKLVAAQAAELKAEQDVKDVLKLGQDLLDHATADTKQSDIDALFAKGTELLALVKDTKVQAELAAQGIKLKADIEKKVADLKAAAVPTVVSVTATNLKEVVVTFNNAVDQTSAETTGNYTLSAGTVSSASLSEDGKSVTLTLTAAAAQQASVDVTVKNVKNAAGNVVANTTKSVTFFDTTVPTATSVAVTGPKTLKVTFSEPLNVAPSFVLDGGSYSINSVLAADGLSATITLGASLPAGDHSLEVSAGADFATFAIAKKALTFAYAADTTAPTVAVTKVAQNKVTLTFSKDIDSTTRGNLTVFHTYNNVAGYAASSVTWTDNKTAVVTFATNYLPIGNATVFVNTGTAPSVVKDTWGNAFASTSLTAAVTADTTAPTVSSVKVVDATHIDVTYSEAVSGALTASNYTLKDADASAVSVTGVADQGNNVYRLTTATLTGGNYSLAIAGIKDTSVAQNALAAYSTNVAVSDLVKPQVNGTGVFSTDNKKVVVGFSEKMASTGTGSVLDKANYQVALDGSTWVELSSISGSSVTLGSDGKSVVLGFGSAQAFVSGTSKVKVARVSDVAGNATAAFTSDVLLSTDAITVAGNVTEIKAVAQNKVTFKVNTALSAIDVTKFNVGGVANSVTGATYVNSGNTSVVTLTIADAQKFTTDVTGSPVVNLVAGALTSALGTSSALDSITLTTANDYIGATIASRKIVDTDGNGKFDKVVLTFSEALQASSVAYDGFTVEGYEVTNVVLTAGNTVTLSLKEKSAADFGATPKVQLTKAVRDNSAQFNTLAAETAGTSSAVLATGVTGSLAVTTQGDASTKEVATLTIATAATNGGTVVVTVGGVNHYVLVAAGDTTTAVAGKIAAVLTADGVTGYVVSTSTNTVVLTASAVGVATDLTATLAN